MYSQWSLSENGTGNQQNDENRPPPMPAVGHFSHPSYIIPPGSPSPSPYGVNSPTAEMHPNIDPRLFTEQAYHTPRSQPLQPSFGQLQYRNVAPMASELHAPRSNQSNVPEVDSIVTKAQRASKKVVKASGTGSKSGSRNRRRSGGSDDEISKLSSKEKKAAGLKNSKAKGGLTEDEKLKVVSYITDEKIWKDFRLKQMSVFIQACFQ
jgi:hypothetical protein